jgi:hypothetical protein
MQTTVTTTRAPAAALLLLSMLGGCATVAPPTAPAPPPPVQLLSAGPLELPSDCRPASGVVYRTDFIVQTDGRVSEARSQSGEGCVQQALQQWVSSFRYRPVDAAVPVAIDWMPVVAARGS